MVKRFLKSVVVQSSVSKFFYQQLHILNIFNEVLENIQDVFYCDGKFFFAV